MVRSGSDAPGSAIETQSLDFSSDVVDILLDELLEPISFDRSENSRHAVEAVIAAVAQGAYAHGLNSARPTAGLYYDMDENPDRWASQPLLRSVDTQKILRMFTDINHRFIQNTSGHGFFKRDYNYALDTSWVTYEGEQAGEDGTARGPLS